MTVCQNYASITKKNEEEISFSEEKQEIQWWNYTTQTENVRLNLGPQEYNPKHPQIHHGANVHQE